MAFIVEHPAHRIHQTVEALRELIAQLGQRGQEFPAHAVVSGARRSEDECEVAGDRIGPEVHALTRWRAIANVRTRSLAAALQRLFVSRNENKPRGCTRLRGFVPGRRCSPFIERTQDIAGIPAFEDMKLRHRTLRPGSGVDMLAEPPRRCVGAQAVHRRNEHTRGPRPVRQPGLSTREHAMMERQRGRGQMEQCRGRMCMPPAIRQAADLTARPPLQGFF